jgi:hypothetical protein
MRVLGARKRFIRAVICCYGEETDTGCVSQRIQTIERAIYQIFHKCPPTVDELRELDIEFGDEGTEAYRRAEAMIFGR